MDHPVYCAKKDTIGNILIQNGKLQQNQLDRALAHQASVPNRIGDILISLGFINEEDLLQALAEQLSLAIYTHSPADEFLPLKVSPPFHRAHPFALLKRNNTENILLINDPLDGDLLSAADITISAPFEVQLALESYLKKLMDDHYDLKLQEDSGDTITSGDESDIDKLKDMASEAPVIKYVNSLIDTAVKRRASDIHIEPFEQGLLIRLRIDGILYDYEIPPRPMQAAIISRTKLLAKLDIAERRLPQDGKICMRSSGKEIDLRVSTLPTVYGEGVVVRILEKGNIILEMSRLGMDAGVEEKFRNLISLPHGIIMVTGPTGSGKTTTLYCALNHINSGSNKIITIEDPVEYQLRGINQIQVKPEIGLTFAKGLRSIVRQDPDIIMVGEIRDLDTAEIAVQSSLTGHLVFSTLHTNDSISAVNRLIDIGVERFLVSSSLRGVLAQRLVRRICPHCTTRYGMLSEFLDHNPVGEDFELFKGNGCQHCVATGYTGRIGIYEILVVDEAIGRGISQGVDLADLKKLAFDSGFKTMFEDGLKKVKAGITTFDEVMRVSRGTSDELV
jgi:general secretion pathway protein E